MEFDMFFGILIFDPKSGFCIGYSLCIIIIIIIIISTYLYRMTISVIVVAAINMGPVFTTPGTSRPTLFE